MKKTLLLSVVASTMIMAGGDIDPVEPVVEAPAPAPMAETSGWDFSGQGVVYYQTIDAFGGDNLFKQKPSAADAGFQLKAVNKDLIGGIGAGVTLNGLTTLGLQNWLVSNVMQTSHGAITGGWIGEMYGTYSLGDTFVKLGRQTLPAGLSPFAHSENWNVFENTYDAALVVNSSLPSTTLVGAWVYRNNTNGYNQFNDAGHAKLLGTAMAKHNFGKANPAGTIGGNYADMASFGKTNGSDGVYMFTAQNKSISDLTLTGTYYYANNFLGTGDALNILWGDAAYNAGAFNVAVQGGTVTGVNAIKDTAAFGAKVGASFGGINAHVAYSQVNDGTTGVFNVGGQQTPLYTQMIINEAAIARDNSTWTIGANTALLGGTFGLGYGATATDKNDDGFGDYKELDVYYVTDMLGGNYLFGYVNMDSAAKANTNNVVRVVARYAF
jgi:hypothetical protein